MMSGTQKNAGINWQNNSVHEEELTNEVRGVDLDVRLRADVHDESLVKHDGLRQDVVDALTPEIYCK